MKNIIYYFFLLMLCFCSKAQAGAFNRPALVESFPGMQYTTDWVHAIQDKDDLRQFDPLAYKKDSWFDALDRQSVIFVPRDTLATKHEIDYLFDVIRKNFKFQDDIVTYGKVDYTATPDEMLVKMAGDCEDFSMMFYYLLASKGFTNDTMNVYSGYYIHDVPEPVGHNVVAVQLADGSEYVLDIMLDKPILASNYMNRYFKPRHRIDYKHVAAY